jgi:hypothetical protein
MEPRAQLFCQRSFAFDSSSAFGCNKKKRWDLSIDQSCATRFALYIATGGNPSSDNYRLWEVLFCVRRILQPSQKDEA